MSILTDSICNAGGFHLQQDTLLSPEGALSTLEANMSIRPVRRLIQSKPTLEGAGVHLRRAFGFDNTSEFDPFLLLDDFRNDVPADYLAGFPWHPHRGIETVTYVLAGTVEHSDSMGNHGAIGAGDIQWMTAGSGIIHQEMPKGDPAGRMHGFQLWANLPSAQKMTPPRYQEIKSLDIPEIKDDDSTEVRVICGDFGVRLAPLRGSQPTRPTSMCLSLRAEERHSQWRPCATRSPMSSEDQGNFVTHPAHSRFQPKEFSGWTQILLR